MLSLCLLGGIGIPAQADQEAAQLRALIEKHSHAIVTVKLLLKSKKKTEDSRGEARFELQGVVVDKNGLIMVPNMLFSPRRLMAAMGMGMFTGGEEADADSTPADIKVLFQGDDREHSAFLAATDSKMDLAFMKVEDLGSHRVDFIDFGISAEPAIGDQVVAIGRLQKGYDYTPYFQVLRVSGSVTRPRKAWMVDGSVPQFGLPVFSLGGAVAGVLTTLEQGSKPDPNDMTASFGMALRMMGAGPAPLPPFIVTASGVKALVTQAQKRAVELAAQRTHPGPESNPAAQTHPKPVPPETKPVPTPPAHAASK
jgi:hypothetical protein